MLDSLRPPRTSPPRHEGPRQEQLPRVRFDLVVTANPDAPPRIVRVATGVPYTLVSLWLGPPRSGMRRMRMTVAGDEAAFETLRKRLARVVDIVKIKVIP